jgi:rod shape determining protein RodA
LVLNQVQDDRESRAWHSRKMRRWAEIYARYDWSLLLAATALSVIGLLALYGIGVTRAGGDLFQFQKQLIALIVGLVIALGFALIDFRQLRSFALPLYVGGLTMLGLVLLVGTSNRAGGRWFTLGAISFQPVELAKILLAVFLAAFISRHAHKRLRWIAFLASTVSLVLYLGLILLQPDFGSAMVLVALWGAMILFCGLPRHAWWTMLLSALVVGTLLWTVGLEPYQRDRITSFLDPNADPYGAAYNVTQARIAIGSGGWFGKGIGEGSQARLRFLPEASNDFMFAVLGEELGFVGIMVILLLFGFILYRLLKIGMDSDDPFAGVLMVGFAAMMLFHLLVNAGMNLGLLPVTGIPLPFASAAASSLITMFLLIGIAQSVAVRSKGRFT